MGLYPMQVRNCGQRLSTMPNDKYTFQVNKTIRFSNFNGGFQNNYNSDYFVVSLF